jgi:hypothetical protein
MYRSFNSNENSEKVLTQPPPSCFPGLSLKINDIHTTPESYFPEHSFSADPQSSDLIDNQYAKRLTSLNEPSLLQLSNAGGFHLRFLWLRSFHAPVVISLQQAGDQYTLTVKQLRGKDAIDSDDLAVDRTRYLTKDELATFSQLFGNVCFWNMPSISAEPLSEDGAWWIVESVWEGRYHIVSRQSPEDGPYRQICLYLLKLSNLESVSSPGEVY